MHVLKFGGSSIGTPDRIKAVMEILQKRVAKGESLAVVFSAYQGVTDQLIRMGQLAEKGDERYKILFNEIEERHITTADTLISLKGRSELLTRIKILLNDLEEILYGVFLIRELTLKTLDYLQSFGERLSAWTISECLRDRGIDNEFIDSRRIVRTDNTFGNARVITDITERNIRGRIRNDKDVYVITGFLGSTDKEETTTLGRGGSDYSASIFGAALQSEEIEIWTDVNGVLTTDPRKVPDAFSIDRMTYEEAMELSHFGARVIHPPTMQPALDKKLPIRILNTFQPEFPGTLISAENVPNRFVIQGISSIDSVALLQIRGSGMVGSMGIAERIFGALARNNINIILISQASSEHSICLAILPELAEKAKSALQEALKYEIHYEMITEIEVEPEMAIIAVVGENMRHRKGIAGRVFQTLGDNGINISAIAQGSSELNISMVVSRNDEARALNVLHKAFFSKKQEGLTLYLAGTGLVGSELLRQIARLNSEQETTAGERIRLAGVCNKDALHLDPQGIDPENWATVLDRHGVGSSVQDFVLAVKKDGFKPAVFVDCTASDEIAALYPGLLENGVSVVTPNKIANTAAMERYKTLRKLSSENRPAYLYETTVGAGLPVIRTIRSLLETGDRILKLEGILSGTLSYLFNTYDGRTAFADVVRKAQELGFTEPDPRIDLSGLDVVRKLLILIRETGEDFEINRIMKSDFLPEEVMQAAPVDKFYTLLSEKESHLRKLYEDARSEDTVLRYIASFAEGEARVALQKIPAAHPFYMLNGSDNIISITSERYFEQPMVIRGPGAGAAVTAAGVLSDILQVEAYCR